MKYMDSQEILAKCLYECDRQFGDVPILGDFENLKENFPYVYQKYMDKAEVIKDAKDVIEESILDDIDGERDVP